jgi:hypothetical protein
MLEEYLKTKLLRNNEQGDLGLLPGLNFVALILHGCILAESSRDEI